MATEPPAQDIPELVPARMVNEFCYCPRLFHFEWVQGRFEHNSDTMQGAYQHRAVDTARGSAPEDPLEQEIRRATAVTVSSARLGVIATIDVLEQDGDYVRPVDVKKGRPPDHAPAWEPDAVQVCVQALALRDSGYQCREGSVYFAETRERRDIPIDETLVNTTLDTLERLRAVAATAEPPPPLVDSPKCPRCSLVGLCLPDETNQLAERSDNPPRRLIPRADAARPMYVTESGVSIGLRQGRITVTRRGDLHHEALLIHTSQINVIGNGQVTTQLLRECFRRSIPVLWFTYGGWFSGLAEGLPAKNVELRRRQATVTNEQGARIAARIVEGKILNGRTLLRRNERQPDDDTFAALKRLATQASEADEAASLLGIEGAAARMYFAAFPTMLRSDHSFDFTHRNRRPPTDPVNSLLSFLYSLLVKDLTAITYGVGLDPYQGVYHRPRFGRPALALDLAEEFRPIVADSVVVTLLNTNEVVATDFIRRAGAVALTDTGRRTVIAAYERRLDTEITHPLFGYKATYRRILETQARLFAAHLLGEIDHYHPFRTR